MSLVHAVQMLKEKQSTKVYGADISCVSRIYFYITVVKGTGERGSNS